MSITTELREWARDNTVQGVVLTTHPAQHPVHGTLESLLAIADRIDAEHEKAAAGCIHYDPERHYCAVHGDTENGWVRLPVDADGVPIHVGDVMEWCDPDGEVTVTCEVDAVGVECFFAWDGANGRYAQKCANAYRHHHPPTVEDVLDEFVARWMDTHHDDLPALKAEYAAKLRLAGDGE